MDLNLKRKYIGNLFDVEITGEPKILLKSSIGLDEAFFNEILFRIIVKVTVREKINKQEVIENFQTILEEYEDATEEGAKRLDINKIFQKLAEQFNENANTIIKMYQTLDDKLSQALENGIPVTIVYTFTATSSESSSDY